MSGQMQASSLRAARSLRSEPPVAARPLDHVVGTSGGDPPAQSASTSTVASGSPQATGPISQRNRSQ